jgi:sugar/nucleoside kinase (ribokinase family)
MTFDLIIVGNIAFDVNTFPGRDMGEDLTITNCGGAGYYSLVPASLFSERVGILARVGNDVALDRICGLGIDIAGLKVLSDVRTTRFHHRYVSGDGQQRSFRPEIVEATLITPNEFPPAYYDASYIHIATNVPATQIEVIELIRAHSKAKISIDTHEAYLAGYRDVVFRAFDLVDIAFIGRHEEELMNRCKAPVKIIKRGKDGITYSSDTVSYSCPAIPCAVIDKTGAGDVLAGVFLVLRARGLSIEAASRKAVDVASASIKDYGVEFLRQVYANGRA